MQGDLHRRLNLGPLAECLGSISSATAPEAVCLAGSRVVTSLQMKSHKRGLGWIGADRQMELMEQVVRTMPDAALDRIVEIGRSAAADRLFGGGALSEDGQRWRTFCALCQHTRRRRS